MCLRDKRDAPFVGLILKASLLVLPLGLFVLLQRPLNIVASVVYVGLNLVVFIGPFTLMLHNISHRPLFHPKAKWGNAYINWILCPFFGQTPHTYFAHHIGMHHPENNLSEDTSSTLRYQRDSVSDFTKYLFRFFFLSVYDLRLYLKKRGRKKLLKRAIVGECAYYALVAALLLFHWQATLVVFIIPLVFIRFAMIAGNWAQHAFIDNASPGNNYRNSITCTETSYNRKCFNDGYHIGHHIDMRRHWSEMPADFAKNVNRYVQEQAIVFAGIDYFEIWFYLMTKRYGRLAEHYRDLGDARPSQSEIVLLLQRRTRKAG